MRSSTLSAVVAIAALSSHTHAAFTMSISRNPEATNLKKRGLEVRSTVTESLINNKTGGDYIATVSVGTPGQTITLAIDTGSSDVWMMSVNADICTSAALQAQVGKGGCSSTYDASKSSTYKLLDAGGFNISYADSSGAQGDYISDVLSIGGATLNPLEMGFATTATLTTGLLGIGYDKNEASDTLTAGSFVYPSIIDTLVNQSIIATKTYSLYLDDLEASTGSIIFGGLDSDKFQGDLVQLPIVPDHFRNGTAIYLDLQVNMTSFSIMGEAGNTTQLYDTETSTFEEFPIVLDSGTSLIYLPDPLPAYIFDFIGAYDDTQNSGQVFVDCAIKTNSPGQTFNFGFGGTGGALIKVPMTELIFPLTDLFYTPPEYVPSAKSLGYSSVCALGLQSGGSDGPFLLGDTFLRSAYVVYDLTNNLIGIAQTNFNSTTSSITEFSATATALPTVSGVAIQTAIAKKSDAMPSTAIGSMTVWSLVLLGVGTAFVALA